MHWSGGIVILALTVMAACSRAPEARQYEVRGQILSLDPQRQEVLVNHEDIEGFMPAMTMPYKVQDPALLEGKEPGDLFTATLVVEEVNAYLTTLTTTGRAPLNNPPAGPAVTDADLLREGDLIPEHKLVNQSGAAHSFMLLRNHRFVLTFIYTRCPLPDFCPLMDKHFADIQRQVAKTPALADVRLVSVTLDPEFDTPAVLEQHAKAIGADLRLWTFLTGDRDEVLAFAKRFGVITEPGDASAPVVHNLRTAVIDQDGRMAKVYSGSMWTPAELVADLNAIQR
jgi:protein SCO1